MDWKGKINALVLVFLIGLITVSAVTVVVNSEAAANAEYARALTLTKGECVVTDIKKTTQSQSEVSSNKIDVEYKLSFTVGEKFDVRRGTVQVSANNEAAIKAAVKTECDLLWASIQAEPVNREKTVIIDYENNVKNQLYDLVSKTWKNKPTAAGS